MGFQLFIPTERQKDSTAHSIPTGFRPTIHIPVKQTPASSSPHRITPGNPDLVKSGRIGYVATILVREKRASDSNSRSCITFGPSERRWDFASDVFYFDQSVKCRHKQARKQASRQDDNFFNGLFSTRKRKIDMKHK